MLQLHAGWAALHDVTDALADLSPQSNPWDLLQLPADWAALLYAPADA